MTEGESSIDDTADIDELASTTARELHYHWSLCETHEKGTESCLIYKLPKHIHYVDRTAYEPIIVSIGPYYYADPALLAMEREKWNCLDYILKLNQEKQLQDYLYVILGLEKQARICYSEEIKMEDKDFLRMLLLDGCFVLVSLHGADEIGVPIPDERRENAVCQEITGGNGSGQKRPSAEQLKHNGESMKTQKGEQSMKEYSVLEVELSQCDASQQMTGHGEYAENFDQLGEWYFGFLAHDVLLLENQIPFFIVKRIYELVAGNNAEPQSFTNRIAKFVENILHDYPIAIQESNRPKDFHHLLHLSHIYFRPSQKLSQDNPYQLRPRYFHHFLHLGRKYFKTGCQSEENEQNLLVNQQSDCLGAGLHLRRWHRAVHYHEAGVKFKMKEFDKCYPHSLLDIRFTNGVVEIPCLRIDENTGSLFRNLIAFEQTCPQFGNDFTAYIFFMSQIISTPADVTLLVQRGIIVHQLHRDEDVSALFTKLNKDVVFDFNGEYYLKSLSWALEAHYRSRLNRWVAWLRNNHFSNPWLGLGALAATVVLFCTLVQTLIAVLSYVKPP